MVNEAKEFTSLFNPVQLWKSGGNVIASCGHACTHLGILIAAKVEEKEELKSLLICGKFSFHVMVYCELFHIRQK